MTGIKFLSPWFLILMAAVPLIVVLVMRLSRRPLSAKRVAASIARGLTITLMALGLAGLSLTSSIDKVNVLFLLDMSDSIDELTRSFALEKVRETFSDMGRNDTAGLIVFGREASVESAPRNKPYMLEIESAVDGSTTNIAGALQIAMATLPDQGENRIVLLSDGNENRGDAYSVAKIARSSGAEIISVPLKFDFIDNEVFIKNILAPSEAKANAAHDITVVLESLQETFARLIILKDGQYAGEDRVTLTAGVNSYTYTASFADKGMHSYEIMVEAPGDTIPENNRSEALVRVLGAPSVLYVADQESEGASLINALTAQDIHVTRSKAVDLPDSLGGLLRYDTIVFDNVPAYDLSLAKMDLIELFIRDAGGGFIMLGGDKSYGVGGYYKTPIERALPVDVDVASSANIPSLSLAMIVDKSGSMGGYTEGEQTKLDLVKEAAYSAVEILNPYYKVGVLAFDADFEWTVPMTEAGFRNRIRQDLYGLEAGGGTNLFEALQEGYEKLRQTASAVKHIIVLSDGLTNVGDFPGLIRRAVEARITISTVAVGTDADRQLMSDIAAWGGGRSYYTDEMKNVPRIFASETIIVSRGLIVEKTFFPSVTSYNDILKGIDPAELPPLDGYILTYLKSGSQQILAATGNNPLLAVRRYGLGKTAAFTSDMKANWGKRWITWHDFPQFTSQLIRWSERAISPHTLHAALKRSQGRATLTIDALSPQGDFINHLELEGVVVFPNQASVTIPLQQVSPGRYSGSFEAEHMGSYFVTVYGQGEDTTIQPETYGMVVPYPREYVDLNPDLALLEKISQITGGSVIYLGDENAFENLFAAKEESSGVDRSLWFALMVLALLLFVVDIAIRKVSLPERFWRSLRVAALAGRSFVKTRLLGARAEDLSYRRMSRMIREKKLAQQEERRRLGILYLFRRERKLADPSARVYMAGLGRKR